MDCKYMTNVMFKRSCLLQADFEGIKNEQHIFTETRDPLNSTINVIHWQYDNKCFKIKIHNFKTAVYGFETFVTYTLYGNFGSEVRMILKVTFDLQKYTQNND